MQPQLEGVYRAVSSVGKRPSVPHPHVECAVERRGQVPLHALDLAALGFAQYALICKRSKRMLLLLVVWFLRRWR
jgi:hypothetical protein